MSNTNDDKPHLVIFIQDETTFTATCGCCNDGGVVAAFDVSVLRSREEIAKHLFDLFVKNWTSDTDHREEVYRRALVGRSVEAFELADQSTTQIRHFITVVPDGSDDELEDWLNTRVESMVGDHVAREADKKRREAAKQQAKRDEELRAQQLKMLAELKAKYEAPGDKS